MLCQAPESPALDAGDGVVGQIQLQKERQVPEGVAGQEGDSVGVQVELVGVIGYVPGDLGQPSIAAAEGLQPLLFRGVAALGERGGRAEAGGEEEEALQEQPHGHGAEEDPLCRRHGAALP